MATIATLMVDLTANVARLRGDMKEATTTVRGAVDDMRREWDRLQKFMGGGLLVAGVYQVGQAMVQAASDAEQASNRLIAVLRATGGQAGLTKEQIDELADSMAAATQFDDESVRNAAAEFLKFGNIRNDVFREGMKLAADYAAFTGGALTDSAQVIGKALQSPTEGVTALQRQIGHLRPEQTALIKQFMELGDVTRAQGVVLDALREKMGGTAEQMNTGLLGATTGAKKAWDEMLESLGRSGPVSGLVRGSLATIELALKSVKDVADAFSPETIQNIAKHGIFKPPVDEAAIKRAKEAADAASGAERDAGWEDRMRKQAAEQAKLVEQLAKKRAAEQDKFRAEEKAKGDRAIAAGARSEEDMLQAQYDAYHDQTRALNDLKKRQREEQAALEEKIRRDDEAATIARFDEAERLYLEQGQANFKRMKDQIKEQENAAKEGERAARELGMTFSSAFEDAIVKGMQLSDVLRGLAQDLLRIAGRKLITEPMAAGLTDVFKGGIGSVLGRVFGGGGEAAGAVNGPFEMPGFATGGSFLVGGSGGTDSQLVSFMASPNERVTVETPAQQAAGAGGGGLVVNQNFNVGGNVTQADIPAIKQAARDGAVEAVLEMARRSPQFRGALVGA